MQFYTFVNKISDITVMNICKSPAVEWSPSVLLPLKHCNLTEQSS